MRMRMTVPSPAWQSSPQEGEAAPPLHGQEVWGCPGYGVVPRVLELPLTLGKGTAYGKNCQLERFRGEHRQVWALLGLALGRDFG